MRKVVVIVTPDFLYNEGVGAYAARIKPLGLTAYGDTAGAASVKVKRMFASMVNAHRERGDVERWLDSSSVEWHWLDEYDGGVMVEEVYATVEERQAAALNIKPVTGFPLGLVA